MESVERVYVVIWEERHTGVNVYVYASEESAISRAMCITDEYDDAEISNIPGTFYYAHLSEEGEHVTVKAFDIIQDDP